MKLAPKRLNFDWKKTKEDENIDNSDSRRQTIFDAPNLTPVQPHENLILENAAQEEAKEDNNENIAPNSMVNDKRTDSARSAAARF